MDKPLKIVLILISVSGCATSRDSFSLHPTNSIDANYILQNQKEKMNSSSPGISFYQNIIGPTLGSKCTLVPSDSQFAQVNFKRCNPTAAIIKSMERFYLEPDAADIGLSVVPTSDGIRFSDLPESCAL